LKILFITLEQSGNEILKTILNDKFFKDNQHSIYTFGLNENYKGIKDLTNMNIKPLMGISDILFNLFYLFKLRRSINFLIQLNDFNHVFFIDSFDFTKFYLKKFLNKKIFYYQIVGPSVFIWKQNRAKFINNNIKGIFSIFEIERSFYDPKIYNFIGHPLIDKVKLNYNYSNNITNIGIFLGSRFQEISKHIKVVKELINKLQSYDQYNYFFFTTPIFDCLIKKNFSNLNNSKFILNNNYYYENISKLDFAFACSGTVHLELSFSHIPHFIFYKASKFNFIIFKYFVKSNFLSLINIFNKKLIIKEFIQHNFTSEIIFKNFLDLLLGSNLIEYRDNMISSLKKSNLQSYRPNIITDYLKKFF